MSNNVFNKNQKILYNNIDDQKILYANQLTTKSWNDIINILKAQANINAAYLERLHMWLVGSGRGTIEIPDGESLADFVLDDLDNLNHRVSNIRNDVNDTTNDLNNNYYNKFDIDTIIDTLSKIFIGTEKEYEQAYNKGLIPVGTLVFIVDDNTSGLLGVAILGQIILGKGV